MKRVLICGDSLTYGYDPRGTYDSRFPEPVRWTYVLEQRLAGEWEVFVKAKNGKEIPSTPSELNEAENKIASCMPFQLFAVMLGTNDYLNMYEPDIAEVASRMQRYLQAVIRMDEMQMLGARILLIAPPAIHTMQDEFYAKYDTTNGAFSRAYRTLAEQMNLYFADAASWDLQTAFDGIHLSEEDNAVFADRMEETIRHIGLQLDTENALEVY